MNVLSLLGVTVQRANGEVIGTSVTVRLVQAVHLPNQTSIFAEAKVEGCCREGDTVVFEHDENFMTDRGIISHDFLTIIKTDNKIVVPLHNKERHIRSG